MYKDEDQTFRTFQSIADLLHCTYNTFGSESLCFEVVVRMYLSLAGYRTILYSREEAFHYT